jgi:DNA-binding MarR family transcriptional regulator/N-acetylglutamate synthase-like GNAT family acetyltransferase
VSDLDSTIASMRRFNRVYTARLGLLDKGLLKSPYSLTEVRVLFELAHAAERVTATELRSRLGLDAGYTSRILSRFERRGLVRKRVARDDARRAEVELTRKGRAVFADLDERATAQVRALLAAMSDERRRRLTGAMREIEEALEPRVERVPYLIRPPRAGDLGWVVHRHGVLYALEYGWDERFEALVARVVADFVEHHDPRRERCFLCEVNGELAGSVFLVKKSAKVAQLRLLLVEPHARGLGIGARLVDECTRFARASGYAKITLWTNSVLDGARRIYERAGYTLAVEEPHTHFGEGLVGQTWELTL